MESYQMSYSSNHSDSISHSIFKLTSAYNKYNTWQESSEQADTSWSVTFDLDLTLVLWSRTPCHQMSIITPLRNLWEIILPLVCVCLCVSIQQSSSRTYAPIPTRCLLDDRLPHWLKPYWNRWSLIKGQDHSDAISIMSSKFSVDFSTVDLKSLMSDQNKIW